ncbi:hypothetical protein EK21DRAFT_112516 [Setomelanomma holmii]|uniref:Uncharacterized protein n=1 Tax=Setomelanomma holmii TaxID=210430 RepID=A0A9P4H8W8_9PLEO|nr:hypothetical protein EK21DRAFT_112516 [Setomelanomma holmii]
MLWTDEQYTAWMDHAQAILDIHIQLAAAFGTRTWIWDNKAADDELETCSTSEPALYLRGGADDRSDQDAEPDAALTGLLDDLDNASSNEILAWIEYDLRANSLPQSASPLHENIQLRHRSKSEPILSSELVRTPNRPQEPARIISVLPSAPSQSQPSPVDQSLDSQPADALSTSPPPEPTDLATLPGSPEQEGEPLTPEESDMLNKRFQGRPRGSSD